MVFKYLLLAVLATSAFTKPVEQNDEQKYDEFFHDSLSSMTEFLNLDSEENTQIPKSVLKDVLQNIERDYNKKFVKDEEEVGPEIPTQFVEAETKTNDEPATEIDGPVEKLLAEYEANEEETILHEGAREDPQTELPEEDAQQGEAANNMVIGSGGIAAAYENLMKGPHSKEKIEALKSFFKKEFEEAFEQYKAKHPEETAKHLFGADGMFDKAFVKHLHITIKDVADDFTAWLKANPEEKSTGKPRKVMVDFLVHAIEEAVELKKQEELVAPPEVKEDIKTSDNSAPDYHQDEIDALELQLNDVASDVKNSQETKVDENEKKELKEAIKDTIKGAVMTVIKNAKDNNVNLKEEVKDPSKKEALKEIIKDTIMGAVMDFKKKAADEKVGPEKETILVEADEQEDQKREVKEAIKDTIEEALMNLMKNAKDHNVNLKEEVKDPSKKEELKEIIKDTIMGAVMDFKKKPQMKKSVLRWKQHL